MATTEVVVPGAAGGRGRLLSAIKGHLDLLLDAGSPALISRALEMVCQDPPRLIMAGREHQPTA